MRARREATPVPTVAGLTGDSLMSFAEAVALVASRTASLHDDVRSARGRARALLTDNVTRGTLALAGVIGKRFRAGELGRFLRIKHPGKFDDIPGDVTVALTGLAATARAGSLGAAALPHDVPGCHVEIMRLADDNQRLEAELRAVKGERDEIKPDADWGREQKAKLRRNATAKRGKREG